MMKSTLTWMIAGLGASLAAVASASAMMLEEFDELSPNQKGRVMADAIQQIHHHVTVRRPDPAKSTCIRNLFLPAPGERLTKGIDLLITELEDVPDEERSEVDLETVLLNFINRECPTVGSAQKR